MKTTVFLIRHGETEWNVQGKFQGSRDIELSKNGILQAHQLKERFENKFDYIYCSPMRRAFETANILTCNMNKDPVIADNLREIDFGQWEGLTIKEIKETYSDEFKTWLNDKDEAPICGGEGSIRLASIRATECIMNIVKKHTGGKIAIVAHGGIIIAGLIGIFQWDMSMYHKIMLGNTAVSELSFNKLLYPKLISLNDTNHLSEDSKSFA